MRVSVVYDGQCPVCNKVVQAVRLKDRSSELMLIDVRSQNVENVQGNDLSTVDFDEGFAVVVDGVVYLGPDGAHALALLTEPTGLFFRIFRLLNRSPRLSRFWYPILKTGRRVLLTLLGIPRINPHGRSGRDLDG